MYSKIFEIRWNDLDANMHLGNSTYVEYMSHTRLSFLTDHGLGLDVMKQHDLGPIVFYEHIYYFKEIKLDMKISVHLEVSGMSEDGRFILFEHNFYDEKGKNLAYSEMLFSWLNMTNRTLGKLPAELYDKVMSFPQGKKFRVLTSVDTRKYGKKPVDLKPSN